MNIEQPPFYNERRYWGSIDSIPGIYTANSAPISFTIEKWGSTADLNHPVEGMNIRISIKDNNFKTFRGKERRIIHNHILAELKNQGITL